MASPFVDEAVGGFEDLTSQQVTTLRALAGTGASLSLLGDFVILHALWRIRGGDWSTYLRIILALTLADVVSSTAYVVADAPAPPPFGSGTAASCSAQAFFEQLGLAAPLLTASLAANYLLVLRYSWPKARIVRLEPVVFAGIVLASLVAAIVPLALDLYHFALVWCWISDDPACADGVDHSGFPCQKTPYNVTTLQMVLFYAPVWAACAFTAVAMYLVYRVVKAQERRLARQLAAQVREFENTRRLAIQASLYVGGFMLTYTFPTVLRITFAVKGEAAFALYALTVFFLPLQGLFTTIAFLFPRFTRLHRLRGHVTCADRLQYVFSLVSGDEIERRARSRQSGADTTNVAKNKGAAPLQLQRDTFADTTQSQLELVRKAEKEAEANRLLREESSRRTTAAIEPPATNPISDSDTSVALV